MANVELINQILNAYRASGVSEEKLAEMKAELQKLNDTQLQQKLSEALNQRGNWGNIGDSFTLNTSPLFEQPAKPQLPVLPKLSVEATIPELTEEQISQFARVSEQRREERRKQTVTLRLSPQALKTAKSLGKGYTSVLSRILESALTDTELIKHYL